MEISKKNDSYDTYNVKLSKAELDAIATALKKNHSDPVADEMNRSIEWYLSELPGPGESKDSEGEEISAAGASVGEDEFSLDSLPDVTDAGEPADEDLAADVERVPAAAAAPDDVDLPDPGSDSED